MHLHDDGPHHWVHSGCWFNWLAFEYSRDNKNTNKCLLCMKQTRKEMQLEMSKYQIEVNAARTYDPRLLGTNLPNNRRGAKYYFKKIFLLKS